MQPRAERGREGGASTLPAERDGNLGIVLRGNGGRGLTPSGFAVLRLLKVRGEMSLSDLARSMNVSKMAALKHVSRLERANLVEREERHDGGVGRPAHVYRMTGQAGELFPKAYSDIAICALSFIERREGRAAVEEVLRTRQRDLLERYKGGVKGLGSLKERVEALTSLRDGEGYMAQSRRAGRGSFEILEYNCPLLALAKRYGEACSTETELFQMVLDADVEALHRAAVGDSVCRFVVRPKRTRPLPWE